jgi:glycosyltransferase involved in cell wall biosynthesis
VLDLAEALGTHADVTVLAPHSPGARRKQTIGRVFVRRFRYFFPTAYESLAYGSGMRDNMERSWLARLQVPFFLVAQLIATIWTMATIRPAVVNAHWLVPQGLTSALAARLLRKPLVLHVHAADVYFLGRVSWGDKVSRFVVGSASAVLADGSHVRDALDEILGYESGATLRPMGVWTDRFGEEVDDVLSDWHLPVRYVVFVGRLVEKKGVEYLIRAMPEVRNRVPTMELVIVGSGPLDQPLRNLAEDLGIANAVMFLGAISHSDVVPVLRRAEVACVPSIIDSRGETEGMPTVVLEAMAAGIPVVGSSVNGIPDILFDRENGWLANPGEPSDLARALVDAASTDRAELIANQGRLTAQDHDWSNVAVQYVASLEKAINED